MAAIKITFDDKGHILPYRTHNVQIWDLDINEIKTVVNNNADLISGVTTGYQGTLAIADTPIIDEIESLEVANVSVEKEFQQFYKTEKVYLTIMPNVIGLPTMDAVALCENMGLKVKMGGVGVVKSQSIPKGDKVKKNQIIVLEI